MRFAIMAFCFAVGSAGFAPFAQAEDATPVSADDGAMNVCAVYGEGYEQIPGTETCVKVGGFIRLDATLSEGSSSGTPPASAPDVNLQLHFDR